MVRDRHTLLGGAVAALAFVLVSAGTRTAAPRGQATAAQAVSYAGIAGVQLLLVAGCGAFFAHVALPAGPPCSADEGTVSSLVFVILAVVLVAVCFGGRRVQREISSGVPSGSPRVAVWGVAVLVLSGLVSLTPPLPDPLGGRAFSAALLAVCGVMVLARFAGKLTYASAGVGVAVLFSVPGLAAAVGYSHRGVCAQAGTTYVRDLRGFLVFDESLRTTVRLCTGPDGAAANVSGSLSGTVREIATATVLVRGRDASVRCPWDVLRRPRITCSLAQHGSGTYEVSVEFDQKTEPFVDDRPEGGPLVRVIR